MQVQPSQCLLAISKVLASLGFLTDRATVVWHRSDSLSLVKHPRVRGVVYQMGKAVGVLDSLISAHKNHWISHRKEKDSDP